MHGIAKTKAKQHVVVVVVVLVLVFVLALVVRRRHGRRRRDGHCFPPHCCRRGGLVLDAPRSGLPVRKKCQMLRAPGLQGHENAGCSARGAPKGSKWQDAPATGPGLAWGLVILNESRGKSRVIPVNWQRNGARDSWDSLISL